MAANLAPDATLIAETGGLNAMIVDSTALPEQAVRDIIASAFQSAGQRCSALRCLYVQEDIADSFLRMLFGAMDELRLGDPWDLRTDVGPVIDAKAQAAMTAYIARRRPRAACCTVSPRRARAFCRPLRHPRARDRRDLEREVFGPVLHVATFKGEAIDSRGRATSTPRATA
jgi:RHH-type proline utilization regulon transcriptional repressor/proline dehydrogenase/delta 1-pyrroline-5-carboxylate dehydrogenase